MAGQRVIVDTTVWSLYFRRRTADLSVRQRRLVMLLRELIGTGLAILPGMVRMEILSGIPDEQAFDRIDDHLQDFDDLPPDADDYVRAARFWNRCRDAGVAASAVDMLICGIAAGRDLEILTSDRDFALYAKAVPIQLHPLSVFN